MSNTMLPEISRLSSYVPGDTLQIFGENLNGARVFVWHPPAMDEIEITDGEMFSTPDILSVPPEDALELDIVTSDSQVLFAQMPYIDPGCLLVWVKNDTGYSQPSTACKPEVWLQSLTTAMGGDRLSFFGRDLYGYDYKLLLNTRGFLKNKTDGTLYEMFWVNAQDLMQYMPSQNDHKMQFRLPQQLPPGEYSVTFSNGTGGKWGWTEPRDLTIVGSRSITAYCRHKWNYECKSMPPIDMDSVNVVRIPAELGDGLTDATDTLQRAIDKVAGGGMVVLPAGRFGVTRTIHLKPGVVLKGAGMGATTLTVADGRSMAADGFPDVPFAARKNGAKCWAVDWKPYVDSDNHTPLVWVETDAGIEDMKLESGNGSVILTLVATVEGTYSQGVFFNQVHFDAGMNEALLRPEFDITYHGIMGVGYTDELTVYKCRIVASNPLSLLPAKNNRLRLIGNHFEVSPRQVCDNVFLGGTYQAMIMENTFKYGRRSLMCQQGFSHNWVFQNRSVGVANTTNANEEYMSEYGYGLWSGNAAAIDGNQVELDFDIGKKELTHGGGTVEDNLDEHLWIMIILSGRGYGQYRQVTHIHGDTVHLDSPWNVTPDKDTYFLIATVTQHNLWVCNFAGTGSGNSQFVYLAGVENIVAGHQIIDAGGMTMYAMEWEEDKDGRMYDLGVVAFNQIKNCDVRYSGMGLCLWTNQSWSTIVDKPIPHMNLFGNIIRYNSFVGGADSHFVKNQAFWFAVEVASGMQVVGNHNVMERNLIAGYDTAVHLRASSRGNLLYKNRLLAERELRDDGSDTTEIESDIPF